MYIDIEPNDNLPDACVATFKETGAGAVVTAVRLHLDDAWQWCAVTGWAAEAPVPATAVMTPIEESGDGPARLVHGGAQGLRLARIADPSAAAAVRWSLADAAQWGEPFLLVRPDVVTA